MNNQINNLWSYANSRIRIVNYTWIINNYPFYRSLTSEVTSSIFNIDSIVWQLFIIPKSEVIGLKILENNTKSTLTKLDFFCLDDNKININSTFKLFNNNNMIYSFECQNKDIFKKNDITIITTIKYLFKNNDLQESYNLKNSQIDIPHDLIIKIEDCNFLVHKRILSLSSPIFKKIINKNQDNKILLKTNKNIIENLLKYIYCGYVSNLFEEFEELLIVALKYQIDDLVEYCKEKLSTDMSSVDEYKSESETITSIDTEKTYSDGLSTDTSMSSSLSHSFLINDD